ncbi:MAG: indolepyruvate ferredoxin oxidoreductase subunit alpha [Vulcanimicrobiota bacterium]
MKPRDILEGKKGDKHFVLGNEAIVRGALEGGLAFAATYPGTPSSEIGDILWEIAKSAGMYFEFSINEKVAMEVAASAAACGLRSMVFMKHVGLNVAADPFMTTVYTGTKGGFLVIVADDPSMHSSQNEQDSRYYAEISRSPLLEPADPLEAYEMMKEGFLLSEELRLPFLVRTTTRVAHIRSVVEFGELGERKTEGEFEKNPPRWVPIPAFARTMHQELQKKLVKAREMSESTRFNREESLGKDPKVGIITSGCAYNYVVDVAKAHDLPLRILKLGMTNPLPEKMIEKFLRECREVLVVEELDPYLEEHARVIAQRCGLDVNIKGKHDGTFSVMYEYNPDIVKKALCSFLSVALDDSTISVPSVELPPRPPVLCPGCSHRATYYAAKVALRKSKIKDAIFPSDIGCYTLGIQPPSSMTDYLLCMGSSMGTGCGISKATGKTVLAFIGDSTFFHSGVAGLINAYHNNHSFLAVILDNRTTAMTGHQPNPGLSCESCGMASPPVDIEGLVKAIGVEYVKTVDPYSLDDTVAAFQEALSRKGLSVIISRRECALVSARARRKTGKSTVYGIKQSTCSKCYVCVTQFACPAFYKEDNGSVHINAALCDGCSVCAQICPTKSIEVKDHE